MKTTTIGNVWRSQEAVFNNTLAVERPWNVTNDAQSMESKDCNPRVEVPRFNQVTLDFEQGIDAMWLRLKPDAVPNCNTMLLADFQTFDRYARERGSALGVRYHILSSSHPTVFNYGGDLGLFHGLIAAGDREGLAAYGKLCIDSVFGRIDNHGCDAITISLVQGTALGGGFEIALTSNIIVAEEGARMGFPEILFNLFPGMGALSHLSRKVGLRLAEQMVLSGKTYTAKELFDFGVVDILAEDGGGEQAVRRFIKDNRARSNGMLGVFKSRHFQSPVSIDELMGIVSMWVDSALSLDARDLKMMSRLARAQGDKHMPKTHN